MSQIKAQEALTAGCEALGLQTDVILVEIKKATRWILAFDQAPDKPNFAYAMIRLERWLKDYLKNPNIELLCEGMDDKNKRDIKSGRKTTLVSARNVESLS